MHASPPHFSIYVYVRCQRDDRIVVMRQIVLKLRRWEHLGKPPDCEGEHDERTYPQGYTRSVSNDYYLYILFIIYVLGIGI